jgi:ankyrin repeat protein
MAEETLDRALNAAERMLRMRNANVPENSTPLMKIVMSGENDPSVYYEILSELPEVSNTLNQQNADGMTALMYAAKKGLGDIMLELLGSGADKNLKNNQGETAADIWEALPDDQFEDDEVKPFFLEKLRDEEEPHAGGRKKTRKSKKSSKKTKKTKKTRKVKKTRRTYALRK